MVTMIMPRLGETVTEGTVIRWLKHEGENVSRDEMIVEISTDKVDSELPAPATGVLSRILVHEEETVPVETELAVIEEIGGAEPVPKIPKAKVEGEHKIGLVVSPLVRRMAKEHNIDPTALKGTGAGGRVTKQDILNAIAETKAPQKEAPAPLVRLGERPAPPLVSNGEQRIPLSHMRKAIAEHMTRSRKTAAHVTAVMEVDMNRIALLREQAKNNFKKQEGFSLTFLPFVAKATIEALQRFPELNSTLDVDELILKHYINLGIAVAVPEGLIVPVIKNAEKLSLIGLARSISDLSERARTKQLKPDEVHEGTFTITNPGGFGSIIQTPIINQPQVGILSLEKVEKRPVAIDDAIAIHWMVYLPLSYDHRVVDGVMAAQFLNRVKKNLEEWDFTPDLGLEPNL